MIVSMRKQLFGFKVLNMLGKGSIERKISREIWKCTPPQEGWIRLNFYGAPRGNFSYI